MESIMNKFKIKAKANPKTIILPEGNDERILRAADVALKEKFAKIIILDEDDSVVKRSKALGLNLSNAQIINPKKFNRTKEFAKKLFELRQHKGMTQEKANELIHDVNYFSIMMLHENLADGIVSGAVHTTADLIRPALQIIKTAEGVNTASSFFFMITENKTYLFADCAFVTNPTANELCEIAISTAKSARQFGIEPKLAMLSFSTKGSGADPLVDKVQSAVKLLEYSNPDFIFDGELQLDAAIVPSVAEKKCPKSPLKGNANVLIFPDLNSGNIGYKLVQRFSNTSAIGPIVQGLKKPVNDLSRGCSAEDVVDVIIVTVLEAQ